MAQTAAIRPKQISLSDTYVASILGVLWGLNPLYYLFFGSPQINYYVIIFFGITVISLQAKITTPRSFTYFSLTISIFFSISLINDIRSEFVIEPYLTLLLFWVNIGLLLAIIPIRLSKHFFSFFFRTTSIMAVIHIIAIVLGSVENLYGRYLFLGQSHPNLGGEIYAVAALAGALSLNSTKTFIFSVPMLISAYFMQTRTGMIVIFLTLILKIFTNGRSKAVSQILWYFAIPTIIILMISIFFPNVWVFFVDNILRFDDPNRGISTGLITGRDARWEQSLSDFVNSPFLGNGMNWYYNSGRESAHNAFLYSFVYFGVFGGIFWVLIAVYLSNIAKRDFSTFLYFCPSIMMLMFNDRFINSNPYPLILYFAIFLIGDRSSQSHLV